jgi:hypothetical protein
MESWMAELKGVEELKGVRSGVERRRGRGLNAARGGWRDAPGKSLRNGVHHANAVVWGPV